MSNITITKLKQESYPLNLTDLLDGQIYEEKEGGLYLACNVSVGRKHLLAIGIISGIDVYKGDKESTLQFRNIEAEIVIKN